MPVWAANPTIVGFIYVGPRDDFGYNQAHAQGAAAVAKMSGVKVVEEEKVPETADVQLTEAEWNWEGGTVHSGHLHPWGRRRGKGAFLLP
jgi:simple sugar transport system substrate-binding protein